MMSDKDCDDFAKFVEKLQQKEDTTNMAMKDKGDNDLEKQIFTLKEENKRLKTIEKSHKEQNGKLQIKLTKAEKKIKKLEEELDLFNLIP